MPVPDTRIGKVDKPDPNATVGDAITYVTSNPSAFVQAIKTIIGFFAALFKPAAKKP